MKKWIAVATVVALGSPAFAQSEDVAADNDDAPGPPPRLVQADAVETAQRDTSERDTLFPLQLHVELSGMFGRNYTTSSVYLSAAYVHTLATDGSWHFFGGAGLSDDIIDYWSRDNREAPDAVTSLHNPGLELDVGVAYGAEAGAPRIALKLTPQWAYGTAMDLPTTDRRAGLRASIGVAAPTWLLGLCHAGESDEGVMCAIGAVLIPTEIEYVFQAVPGDTRHGIAIGWSL